MNDWLLIAGDFTPLGGMDRANHALARGLASRGDRVSLVTHRAWTDLDERIHVSRVPRPAGSHLLGAPLLAAAGASAARSARGRVVGNGGNTAIRDITWIHYLHAAYAPRRGAALSRVRASLAHHYYLRQERAAVRTARHIVCNSRRTADDITHAYGTTADRVKVVYYGTDASAFAPVSPEERCRSRRLLAWPETRPVALFIGALGDQRKGFDRLFEAWQILSKDTDWDVDLAVAGSGRELPRWQARANENGLSSIHFLGFRDDIAMIIAASDVVVHPSRYEAYGLGVHEALSRGLPAIVSARAGVAERMDGLLRSLLIDDVESASEIAARLRRWRGAADAYRAAAAIAGDRLRTHTWDDMVESFVRAVA